MNGCGTRCRAETFRRGLQRRAAAEGLVRLHRDEQGGMLDYVMVLAVLIPLIFFVFRKMFEVLSDYFGMIAFYVSWPFL